MDIEHVCFKFISSVNPKNITETGNSTIISTINNILADLYPCQEEFEDTKGVKKISVNQRRTGNTMAKRKTEKEQTCSVSILIS